MIQQMMHLIGRPTALGAEGVVDQVRGPLLPFASVEALARPGPVAIDLAPARGRTDRAFGPGRVRRAAPWTPAITGSRHGRYALKPCTASGRDQRAADPLASMEADDRVPRLGVGIAQDLKADPVEDPVAGAPIAERGHHARRRAAGSGEARHLEHRPAEQSRRVAGGDALRPEIRARRRRSCSLRTVPMIVPGHQPGAAARDRRPARRGRGR